MKRTIILFTVIVLTLLTLTACGKSEFGGLSDESGKLFTVTAERADQDSFFIGGSLEVEDGEQIVFTSNLTKGTIEIVLIRDPEEQSIDELPDFDGAESYKYEFSSTDSAADLLPSGSYLVNATCLKKASGTVQLEVKPAEQPGQK